MVKTLAAAGVLAIAGSALAAPFQVNSALIFAEGSLSDATVGNPPFTATSSESQVGGVFWNNGFFGLLEADAPALAGANLLGAHPGGFPASGLPQTAGLAENADVFVAPIAGNDFTGAGDDSWNVGFQIASTDNAVGSAPGAFGNDVWIGRVAGGATISNLAAGIDGAPQATFVLDGPGVEVNGQTLFAVSSPVGGDARGGGAFDIIITDLPSPGAAALLGLAGFAGLRRRRA